MIATSSSSSLSSSSPNRIVSYRTNHILSLSLSSGQPLPRITPSLTMTTADHVPVIDLSSSDEDLLVQQIAVACENPGFFQVTHHGVPLPLVQDFRRQCRDYFDQPASEKLAQKRHSGNARGYFDDELTQQRRDWKECCDIGQPGSKDWNTLPDDSPENACLDGFNQFPTGCRPFEQQSLPISKRVKHSRIDWPCSWRKVWEWPPKMMTFCETCKRIILPICA
jgi:isopenicillin N synthase-like dioxygenase